MTMLDLALLIMRIVLGVIFIAHGSQKLFGAFGGSGMTPWIEMTRKLGVAHPVLLGWLGAFAEFGGGVLVLLGLLTPLAAALIISSMLVAIIHVHAKNGLFNTNRGYEFNLSLIAISLALILTGAGTVSFDHLLGIAVPLSLLPAWFVILLVIVIFSGAISTDISQRIHRLPPADIAHRQGV